MHASLVVTCRLRKGPVTQLACLTNGVRSTITLSLVVSIYLQCISLAPSSRGALATTRSRAGRKGCAGPTHAPFAPPLDRHVARAPRDGGFGDDALDINPTLCIMSSSLPAEGVSHAVRSAGGVWRPRWGRLPRRSRPGRPSATREGGGVGVWQALSAIKPQPYKPA